MISLSLAKIAEITGGTAHGADGAATVTGPVVIDSRTVQPGALFVAVRGERADGNDFAAAAVAAGAAGVLTDSPPDGDGVPAVVVDDVVKALGVLARAVVAGLPDATVIGVTGSSGKTSTKDLIAQLTVRRGPTVAPVGSFNNEIGHPLTALRADEDTRYLVLEYSARGIGHIAYLTEVAPPRVGVVLNVGTAHIGEFGSREMVARAKGELVEALPPGGTAILNADDPLVRTMAARTPARIVTFGRAPDATVRATEEWLDEAGRPRFSLVTPEGTLPVSMRLHGSHTVGNALAAAAAAREVGMPLHEITEALSEATAVSRWRMEVSERSDGVTVVNDAYNANPESVRAALDALRHMSRGEGTGTRRAYAVLAGMAELGAASVTEHEKIGQHAARCGLAGLIVVGPDAAPMLEGAKQVGSWTGECVQVDDVGAAVAALNERLRPRDVVLVKGSRVAGLERVAQALLDDGPDERPGGRTGA
ncbi:UDP-N-acetylmuramoyl-tripeptide--D-alanyl-D-alanine ligase [Actinomadura alba]|uniref:UDP-N-acetylmuramoyl-tripeptide--D-alanyl-D-alanine ligase n=1 Tax=Actinomadura alba TaxID=406431 RepID=A0ABR7LLA8_9ACTN|nr:UDP-N-acetylmuramoyl-tripeptide--D-alanyl-D-alanine ligase [Actinomadura alba]MBC6465551.1 UDP-N-acetylmuramoyl-tripeptide--D-alanyl-D-alanine ligase [Actinomadura alba]